MKTMQKLLDAHFAKKASGFMKFVCYLEIAFFITVLVLTVAGRQTFILYSDGTVYEKAIYAEEDHDPSVRGFTVGLNDDIRVWDDKNGEISPAVQAGIMLMTLVHLLPLIFSRWFLSRVFSNVHSGYIFTEENAAHLLRFGVLSFVTAIPVPLIKTLVCSAVTHFSACRMSLSTGSEMPQLLITGAAFLVAAYIIHYGIGLQDEVDHTL